MLLKPPSEKGALPSSNEQNLGKRCNLIFI